MAKKKKGGGGGDASNIALQALQIDVEYRNRELAFRVAADAAERAFQQKRMELVEQGQLQQQADQFARQFALQTMQFEFERELNIRQLGLSERAQQLNEGVTLREQAFNEAFRQSQLTGFVHTPGAVTPGTPSQPFVSQPTSASPGVQNFENFDPDRYLSAYPDLRAAADNHIAQGLWDEARARQWAWEHWNYAGKREGRDFPFKQAPAASFDPGTPGRVGAFTRTIVPTFQREQFERTLAEQGREFDIKALMEAPRGAADYLAYLNRLRGLNESGLLPGAVGALFRGEAVAGASDAGARVPVATNTQFAQGLIGASPGAGARWGGPYGAGNVIEAAGGLAGGGRTGIGGAATPGPEALGGGPYVGNPYADDTQAARRMLAPAFAYAQPSVPRGREVSLQQWRRLAPKEQEFALGAVQEYGPQEPEDFLHEMQWAAPRFERSAAARFVGV